jgi:hypothetical protein
MIVDDRGHVPATDIDCARADYDASLVARWLWLGAAFAVLWLITYSLVAVPLAMLGRLNVLLTALIAIPLAGGCTLLLRSHAPPSHGRDRWSSAIVLLVAFLSFGWNADHAGNHVLIDRDPASYLTTGRWMASEGSLRAYQENDLLRSSEHIVYGGSAVFEMSPGVLEFQFNHAPAAVYAIGYRLFGASGLFAMPAAIGSITLVVLYIAFRGFFRGSALPTAGIVALAISLPFLHVARDGYSELFVVAVVWFALAFSMRLAQPGVTDRWFHHTALGLLAGSGSLFRIDAWVYAAALFAVYAVVRLRARTRLGWLWFILGAIPPLLVGYVDAEIFGGVYVQHHWTEVRALGVFFVLVAVGSIVLDSLVGRMRWLAAIAQHGLPHAQAATAATCASILFLLGWLVRPHVQQGVGDWAADSNIGRAVAELQTAAGVDVNPLRSYAELSIQSLSWYYGAFALGAAIIGTGLIVYRALRRPSSSVASLAVSAAICCPLYLVRPSITPDHLWATRRYIVFIIPMLLFAVLFAAREASEWISSTRSRMLGVIPIAVTTLGLVIPVGLTTRPLRNTAPTRGHFAAIDETCDIVGNSTVVEIGNYLLAMPLRAWCGSTVGIVAPEQADDTLASIERAVHASCVPVFVVSRGELTPSVADRLDNITKIAASSHSSTAPTLLSAPSELTETTLEINVGRLRSPETCL